MGACFRDSDHSSGGPTITEWREKNIISLLQFQAFGLFPPYLLAVFFCLFIFKPVIEWLGLEHEQWPSTPILGWNTSWKVWNAEKSLLVWLVTWVQYTCHYFALHICSFREEAVSELNGACMDPCMPLWHFTLLSKSNIGCEGEAHLNVCKSLGQWTIARSPNGLVDHVIEGPKAKTTFLVHV